MQSTSSARCPVHGFAVSSQQDLGRQAPWTSCLWIQALVPSCAVSPLPMSHLMMPPRRRCARHSRSIRSFCRPTRTSATTFSLPFHAHSDRPKWPRLLGGRGLAPGRRRDVGEPRDHASRSSVAGAGAAARDPHDGLRNRSRRPRYHASTVMAGSLARTLRWKDARVTR